MAFHSQLHSERTVKESENEKSVQSEGNGISNNMKLNCDGQ